MARSRSEPEPDAAGGFPALADATPGPLALTGLDQPLWLQNSSYPASLDRQLIAASMPPGVRGTGELAVSQRAAGANMSVDVAAGRAVVPITDSPNQGSALVRSTALNNLAVAGAPAAGTSRIDLVIARVYDASLIGGSVNGWQLEVVTGTAASSPVAPTLPPSSIELARLGVASGQASVQTANITDRRDVDPPKPATVESVFNLASGGTVNAIDVAVTGLFSMPFLGHIVMQAEVQFLPGTGAGSTVTIAKASGTSPAPFFAPSVYGPLQPANATRTQLSVFGFWQAVPARTVMALKVFVQSSAGAGAEVVLDHIAGCYRFIPA
jgi:hypothetical protein